VRETNFFLLQYDAAVITDWEKASITLSFFAPMTRATGVL
jgi:hypothetical protein